MTFTPFAGPAPLQVQDTTGPAGFALVNATPTILSWTAPDDGQLHRVILGAVLHVSAAETGGEVAVNWTGPFAGAQVHTSAVYAAGLAADVSGQYPSVGSMFIIGPGTTLSIFQLSALTAGAATLWAEIWGS